MRLVKRKFQPGLLGVGDRFKVLSLATKKIWAPKLGHLLRGKYKSYTGTSDNTVGRTYTVCEVQEVAGMRVYWEEGDDMAFFEQDIERV